MFLNAMYGGIGQSLGAIIGGKLQMKVGTVKTFVYSAIFDFCFICIVIVYLTIIKTEPSSFHNPQQIGLKNSSSSTTDAINSFNRGSNRANIKLKNNKFVIK